MWRHQIWGELDRPPPTGRVDRGEVEAAAVRRVPVGVVAGAAAVGHAGGERGRVVVADAAGVAERDVVVRPVHQMGTRPVRADVREHGVVDEELEVVLHERRVVALHPLLVRQQDRELLPLGRPRRVVQYMLRRVPRPCELCLRPQSVHRASIGHPSGSRAIRLSGSQPDAFFGQPLASPLTPRTSPPAHPHYCDNATSCAGRHAPT